MKPEPATIQVNGRTVEFVSVACDLCGSREQDAVFSGPDRYLQLPGVFTVVRCRHCALLRQDPQPTAKTIDAYYPTTYEAYSPAIEDVRNPLRRWDLRYGMRKRRRLIEKYRSGGDILDVGCATGNFLAEMQVGGQWQVAGVEPSPTAARFAAERHGIDVRAGDLVGANLPDASFDVITMWNVLEHTGQPIRDLRRVHRLLKPGGYLVFSLPNLESFEARLFGRRWFTWELPRHLYFFPRPVLKRLLVDLNFDLVKTQCLSGSQLGFAQSLKYMYSELPRQPRWNQIASSILFSVPGRAIMLPTFFLASRLGEGYVLTYVVRKQDGPDPASP